MHLCLHLHGIQERDMASFFNCRINTYVYTWLEQNEQNTKMWSMITDDVANTLMFTLNPYYNHTIITISSRTYPYYQPVHAIQLNTMRLELLSSGLWWYAKDPSTLSYSGTENVGSLFLKINKQLIISMDCNAFFYIYHTHM